jgi:hypothetical protein
VARKRQISRDTRVDKRRRPRLDSDDDLRDQKRPKEKEFPTKQRSNEQEPAQIHISDDAHQHDQNVPTHKTGNVEGKEQHNGKIDAADSNDPSGENPTRTRDIDDPIDASRKRDASSSSSRSRHSSSSRDSRSYSSSSASS